MADQTMFVLQQSSRPIKILKWKVSAGDSVSTGRVIFTYCVDGSDKAEQRKFKSMKTGTVRRLLAQEGAIVNKSEGLLELEPCIHPTVMRDMCAECGADLRKVDATTTASVPMVHSIPELKVSEEQAQKLGKADSERLLKDRKLVLLVDLDQTLIHTTNDNIPANIRDVYHFQLYGPSSPWYHTRLRPGTHNFLDNVSSLYELHICTFGARNYAHTVTAFLDIDQRFFSNRILSRDECFDATSKKANLKALFPCGDNMVCIIDDREDVWSHASNLIHVKPYHFFQHTGDINAPPGLDKQENDNKQGIDLSKVKVKNKIKENGKNTSEVVKVNEISKGTNENSDIHETKEGEKNIDDVQKKNEADDDVTEENDTEESTIENKNYSQVNEIESERNGDIVDEENLTSSEKEKVGNEEADNPANSQKQNDDDMLDIEDYDDYLLFLEEILKKIHTHFYEEYDKLESGRVPDLKEIIPKVRSQVLSGTNLVFSGLVPTHIKLAQSKAYQVAKSLGANVTQDLEDDTTHLVAVRPGTAKVNAGKRKKNIKIVTPDWLWSCAERWEHVSEIIFPLSNKGSRNRHPPPHCSSPEHVPNYPVHDTPALRKRTPSGRFMDTINPLMAFSSDDIADMDKEVEDIMDADSDSEDEPKTNSATIENANNKEESSSSDESLTGEYPRGFKRNRENHGKLQCEQTVEEDGNSSADEFPSTKFRRGENLDSDMDIGDSNSEGSIEPPDEVDDGEWNMMGAALEREFLSNN